MGATWTLRLLSPRPGTIGGFYNIDSAAVIGIRTGKIADLPIYFTGKNTVLAGNSTTAVLPKFYRKECRIGSNNTRVVQWSCLSKIYGDGPDWCRAPFFLRKYNLVFILIGFINWAQASLHRRARSGLCYILQVHRTQIDSFLTNNFLWLDNIPSKRKLSFGLPSSRNLGPINKPYLASKTFFC